MGLDIPQAHCGLGNSSQQFGLGNNASGYIPDTVASFEAELAFWSSVLVTILIQFLQAGEDSNKKFQRTFFTKFSKFKKKKKK